MSDSVRPHRRQPTRLPCPWDYPGKNTGVACRFLLQCMKVKSESEVAQLCPTPSDPMDCSLPGSSIHGIFQARVLEWGANAFSIFGCKEYNQSDFGIDYLVMSMFRIFSCCWKVFAMTSVFSWQNSVITFALLHLVLQSQICLSLQVSLDFLLLHRTSFLGVSSRRSCRSS